MVSLILDDDMSSSLSINRTAHSDTSQAIDTKLTTSLMTATNTMEKGVSFVSIQYEEPLLSAADIEQTRIDWSDHDESDDECASESSESLPQFRPSLIYLVFRAVISFVFNALESLWLCRWRILLPLYRRIDLPGLRGFAIIELLMILAYVTVNAYYLLPHMFHMFVPLDSTDIYIGKMSHSAFKLGLLGTWNVLALWLPITRYSIWNYLFGISFDRAIFYHIHVSRLAVFILMLHGFGLYAYFIYHGMFAKEFIAGGFTGITPSGGIALLGGLVLCVTSFEFIRRRWWEFFMKTHYVGLGIFSIFGMIHHPLFIKITLAGVVLYGVDVLIRCYKWTKPVKVIDARVLEGDITRLEWTLEGFEFEAGQFVMVCIPLLSPFEWHPFSIASSPHHKSVVLYSRREGEWTTRLQQLAESFDPNKPFRIYIEGPYGNLTVPLPMYKQVMLIGGGLGATPMLSIYNDIKHNNKDGRTVQLIWTMRDQRALEAMWKDNQQHDLEKRGLVGDIPGFTEHFHITSNSLVHSDCVIINGRPPLNDMFEAMEEQLVNTDFRHCAVLVCGPKTLINQCRKLCAKQSKVCGSRVCFDMHDERYEW